MIKKEKGITMVALVITIIILLILASISIKGGISNKENTKEEIQKAELQTVQHAILERYTKAQLTKETQPGTKLSFSEAQSVIDEVNTETGKGIALQGMEYYRLDKNDLKKLEIDKATDTYIVNYKTGEVLNESRITTSSGELLYTSSNKVDYGYVDDGLVLHYDGINNTGSGHSSTTTTWKNLVGNNNNGTIINAIVGENNVQFNGESSWVNCGELNNEKTTLEVTIEANSLTNENWSVFRVLGNWQNKGCGIYISNKGVVIGDAYTSDSWNSTKTSNNAVNIDKKYNVALSYDGYKVKLYVNGLEKVSNLIEGSIENPNNNTVMVLGCDPNGNEAVKEFFNGKIYSARIYNRALTDEEVENNWEIDKARFNITE